MGDRQVVAVWRLERRDLLTLQLRRGDRLRCEDGTVWCTVDGAMLDLVLEAGQTYEARTPQRLHASGLRQGRLSLLQRRAREGCVSTSAPAAPSSTNSSRL